MPARQPERARRIRSIARRLSSAGGFALPTTMAMLMAGFAIVSVGVATTVSVQRGTVRDEGTKASLQLAQTGVNEALLRFNRNTPTTGNACSPLGSTPGTGGWCPAVTVTDVTGGTFTYEAHPYAVTLNGEPTKNVLEVVGTGRFGNATRRVHVTAESLAQNVFGDAQVKTSTGISMDSNSRIHASAATNGDITLASNAKQCGPASVGIGRQLTLTGNAGYFQNHDCTSANSAVQHQQLTLPTVNQGDAATNNDNSRLFTQDLVSGNKNSACFNGHNGSGGNDNSCGGRELAIGTNSAVTLTGGTYSFCSLTMRSNSALYIAAGHTVAIYFDSPEACGYASGVVQLDMASNTRITATDGSAANVAMLFVGSSTRQTLINLSSNTAVGTTCQQNFVIYAPLSDIDMNSNSTYCGAIGAKSLHLDSNADLNTDPTNASLLLPPVSPHYSNPDFVECNVATGSTPTTGC
jgi:type II secretory pathway pseudopilin PulG